MMQYRSEKANPPITKKSMVVDLHDDVIKWKHFPRYWSFVRGIHRSPVNSPHKGRWCGTLIFSLICAWTDSWASNGDAGDLRCHRAHYNAIAMAILSNIALIMIFMLLCSLVRDILIIFGFCWWAYAYISRMRFASIMVKPVCPRMLGVSDEVEHFVVYSVTAQIAEFMGPTWGPSGSHVGPVTLAIRMSIQNCATLKCTQVYGIWF